MDKKAQDRGGISKIWESINLDGKALEWRHKEIAKIMDRMREVDEKVRVQAVEMREFVKPAKQAIKKRDYMSAASHVVDIHRRARAIELSLSKFISSEEIQHFEFILDNADDISKSNIFSYDPKQEKKEAFTQALNGLNKTADDLARARRALEKNFKSGFISAVKSKTISIVDRSLRLFVEIKNSLNIMESGISGRNIDIYVINAKKLIAKISGYHEAYLKYDTDIIQPLKAYYLSNNKKEMVPFMPGANSQVPPGQIGNPLAPSQTPNPMVDLSPLELSQNIATPAIQNQPVVNNVGATPEKVAPSISVQSPTVNDSSKEEPISGVKDKEVKESLEPHDSTTDTQVDIPKLIRTKDMSPEEWERLQKIREEELAEKNKQASKINNIVKTCYSSNEVKFINNLITQCQNLECEDPVIFERLLTIASDYSLDFANDKFIKHLETISETDNNQEFVNAIIDHSELVEQFDTQKSGELLSIASEIAGLKKKAVDDEKPKYLREYEDSIHKIPGVQLQNGPVDKKLTSLKELGQLTLGQIHLSSGAVNKMKNDFIEKLKFAGIGDFSQYASYFTYAFDEQIRQSVHNGFVTRAYPVNDAFQPHDKYLDIFVQIPVGNLVPEFSGTINVTLQTRFSAKKRSLSIGKVVKWFKIEDLEEYEFDAPPETMRNLNVTEPVQETKSEMLPVPQPALVSKPSSSRSKDDEYGFGDLDRLYGNINEDDLDEDR